MNTHKENIAKVMVVEGGKIVFQLTVDAQDDMIALQKVKAHLDEHHPKLAKRVERDKFRKIRFDVERWVPNEQK